MAAQTGKGTPASVPTVKYQLAGSPSLMPQRDRARYLMTGVGRDQGAAYTAQMRVEGDMSVYLHPDGFWVLAYGVLGAHALTGTPPKNIETATPANDIPWFTMWRMVGGNLFEKFTDCKLGSMTVEGTAGSPPMATVNVLGATSLYESSDTVLEALNSRPYVYHESCGKILIDGNAHEISRVTLGVDNNVSGYQADCISLADIDVGNRDVTLSILLRYQSPSVDPSYNELYYGSKTPAAEAPLVDSVGVHTFEWQLFRDADDYIKFTFPQVLYQAIEVNPDPGGDPIEIDLACDVEKKDQATPIITIVDAWDATP
jgi:hypothetical protein